MLDFNTYDSAKYFAVHFTITKARMASVGDFNLKLQ